MDPCGFEYRNISYHAYLYHEQEAASIKKKMIYLSNSSRGPI